MFTLISPKKNFIHYAQNWQKKLKKITAANICSFKQKCLLFDFDVNYDVPYKRKIDADKCNENKLKYNFCVEIL